VCLLHKLLRPSIQNNSLFVKEKLFHFILNNRFSLGHAKELNDAFSSDWRIYGSNIRVAHIRPKNVPTLFGVKVLRNKHSTWVVDFYQDWWNFSSERSCTIRRVSWTGLCRETLTTRVSLQVNAMWKAMRVLRINSRKLSAKNFSVRGSFAPSVISWRGNVLNTTLHRRCGHLFLSFCLLYTNVPDAII